MMSDGIVLELEQVTVRYGDALGLDDVSFTVRAGEIHGLLGDNGAGKTTLLKALAGLAPQGILEGHIRVGGQPVTIKSPAEAFEHGIGIVPRRAGIFGGLSVADNILVGAWQQERGFLVNKERNREQAQRALDAIGLKLHPFDKAGSLTPGQQRMLMLARAVVRRPKVIVLDEPAAFLTTAGELSQLFRTLRILTEQEIALLYLSRRPNEVLQIADRITVLRDGKTNGEWARSDFDETALVRAMMSQRVGDAGYIDHDDLNQPRSGWFDGLRGLFSGNKQ